MPSQTPGREETGCSAADIAVSSPASPERAASPHLIVVDGDGLTCIGARMKAARDAIGFSHDQMYRLTRIPVRCLRAIEAMDYDSLPETPYLRGHLRSYSSVVGLDPRQVVGTYIAQLQAGQAPATLVARNSRRIPLLLAIVAVILLAACGTRLLADMNGRIDAGEGSAAAPDGSSRTEQTPATASVRKLVLVVHRPVRVEIRGADGTVFLSRVMTSGQIFPVRPGNGWTVTAEDGNALSWRLDGRDLGPLSEGGRIYAIAVDKMLGGNEGRPASG